MLVANYPYKAKRWHERGYISPYGIIFISFDDHEIVFKNAQSSNLVDVRRAETFLNSYDKAVAE